MRVSDTHSVRVHQLVDSKHSPMASKKKVNDVDTMDTADSCSLASGSSSASGSSREEATDSSAPVSQSGSQRPKRSRVGLKKRKTPKDTTSGQFVCHKCQPKRYFKKNRVLSEHTELIHAVSPHPCLWCAKQFFNESQLLVHQKLYSHDKPLH